MIKTAAVICKQCFNYMKNISSALFTLSTAFTMSQQCCTCVKTWTGPFSRFWAHALVCRGVARTPQTYKMESFAIKGSYSSLLTIVTKLSILDVCCGPGYASGVTEAVVRRCSVKKGFLEISQNSQKTPVSETLF